MTDNTPFHPYETSKSLILAIARKRDMNYEEVEKLLSIHVLLPGHFLRFTGLNRSSFENLCRPKVSVTDKPRPAVLKRVFPLRLELHDGPLFIERNESCDNLLKKYNDIK